MKFIVFDGDFHEEELDWLEEPAEKEEWETWEARMGFHKYSKWSSGDPMMLRDVVVIRHEERQVWHVTITVNDCWHSFLVIGEVNYLKFLASPLFAAVDLYDQLVAIQATVQAAFRAWHGHNAPSELHTHSFWTSCDGCDPDGKSEREEHRMEIEKRRQEMEKRKAARTGKETT